ncbi:MAG TPA: amylo-alpha-1,6-glucosidase [Candidatus Binatia bacterium]|jgi:predicted glycogen debranching enzyme|nr:amylo-alpha-1,6-glucosidase [Candidatus Binatia bacterium]
MPPAPPHDAEWLEADGLGGFASGTVDGIRTRRYHALLLVATAPPTGRMVLVNGLEAWIDTSRGTFPLTSQRYQPDVVWPAGASHHEAFTPDPWPTWTIALPDGTRLVHEILVRPGMPATLVSWRLLTPQPNVRLRVRLLLSGRDYHSLHHENPGFRFDADVHDHCIAWNPYPGVPAVVAHTNGGYRHAPDWYQTFLYTAEEARGLDCVEDLASPGELVWDLSAGEATLLLGTRNDDVDPTAMRDAERVRRGAFATPLHRAADAYLVRRGEGRTVIAGYPWFTDWGRDTFIALRGLCLATGRLDEARSILLEWAGTVSEGMLPNRFPDTGETPEFNAVDASLWFVVAVHELLQRDPDVPPRDARTLRGAVETIVTGYATGTRHHIHVDRDGLVAAGEPGMQLTWMDARVGDRVVTPRIGKPVEIQALWLNALSIAAAFSPRWTPLLARAQASFVERFWYADGGHLYDVVDVDHQAGTADATFRPNQIFAVGGLPVAVLDGERARRVVDAVEVQLWTPLGMRTLAPSSSGYTGHYRGDSTARDGAYHQGTAWPWLVGPFVEAWVRVRGDTAAARREARTRFLEPLLASRDIAGLGHVTEVADGDPPFTPGGCPFQAWSVGEALRLDREVLAEPA